jgi:hypothetical protein
MCILNTEGCNLLENLDEEDYMHCLDLLRDIILGERRTMKHAYS